MDDRKARITSVNVNPVSAARVPAKSVSLRGGKEMEPPRTERRYRDAAAETLGRSRVLFDAFLAQGSLPGHEVLDHAKRRRIYDHIRAFPGETYSEVMHNLSLSKGGLTYHLEILKREGLVRSRSEGGRTMLYSVEARPPANDGGRPLTQERFLRTLARWPGTTVSDVAGILGISRQLATHHARLLAQQGLVRLERREDRLCAIPVRRCGDTCDVLRRETAAQARPPQGGRPHGD